MERNNWSFGTGIAVSWTSVFGQKADGSNSSHFSQYPKYLADVYADVKTEMVVSKCAFQCTGIPSHTCIQCICSLSSFPPGFLSSLLHLSRISVDLQSIGDPESVRQNITFGPVWTHPNGFKGKYISVSCALILVDLKRFKFLSAKHLK